MYECGKLKKVIGNKFLFPVILEQCGFPPPPATPIPTALILGRRKLPSKQQVDGVLKDKFIKSQLDLMGTCNGL